MPRPTTYSLYVDQKEEVVDKTSRHSIHCEKGIGLVRQTRMADLCYSIRPGGVLQGTQTGTTTTPDGSRFAGSEFTCWTMPDGSVTSSHIDTYNNFDVPAAGTLTAVDRRYCGLAKRAIVMSSRDRERVVASLGLDTSKSPALQYRGKIRCLESLAAKLQKEGIRFAVMEFPTNSSYLLPAGCGHMFVTFGLVESCTWHPSLRG